MTTYDYNLLSNFNVNIRVERFKKINSGDNDPILLSDIPYSQARLSKNNMEEILASANSVADNVTIFYKEDSGKSTLSHDELMATKPAITQAIRTLVDNVTNDEFMAQNVHVLHEAEPDNPNSGLNSYIYQDDTDDYQTKVYLTYMPNILSATLIYPNRPGAVINNFNEMEY